MAHYLDKTDLRARIEASQLDPSKRSAREHLAAAILLVATNVVH
jgi:hypothetical protein